MADITMCQNKDCPLKETCYRFKAIPSPYRQVYSDFKFENGKCKDYWEVKEKQEEDR